VKWRNVAGKLEWAKILDKTILPLKAEFYAREKTPGIQVGNG
jgi:hypothetical protein